MKNRGKEMRRRMVEERGETRFWIHRSATSFSLTVEANWDHINGGK